MGETGTALLQAWQSENLLLWRYCLRQNASSSGEQGIMQTPSTAAAQEGLIIARQRWAMENNNGGVKAVIQGKEFGGEGPLCLLATAKMAKPHL